MPPATRKPPSTESQRATRRFAGRGAALFLVRLLPALAVLAVMLLLSRQLNRTAYGLYQNFWVRYALLSTITCLGFPAFVMVLRPEQVRGLIRGLRWRHWAVFAALNGVLGCLFAAWEHPGLSVWLPPALLLVFTAATLLESVLLVAGRYGVPLVCNAVYALLFVGIHLLWNGNDREAIFRGILFLGAGRGLALLVGALPVLIRGVAESLDPRDWRLWRQTGFYDLLQQGARVTDKVLVSFLVPAALSAVYFNGAQEVPFLPLLLGAAGGSLLQQVAGTGSDGSKLRWARLTGRLLASLVFPLFWWLFLFRDELFAVVFSDRYLGSVPIFAMTTLVLPLRAYPFTALLQHHRRGALINAGAVLDLAVAAGLAPVLFSVWGLPGIALAFAAATVVQALFYLIVTASITGTPVGQLLPLRNWAGKMLLVGAGFLLLRYSPIAWTSASIRLVLGGIVAGGAAVLALRHDLKNADTAHAPDDGSLPHHS